MKRILLLFVLVLSLASASLATATDTWSDPVGDSGTAPDITSVQVSNSDDGALITFVITVRMRAGTWIGAIVDPVEGGWPANKPRYIVIGVESGGSLTTTVYDYSSRQVIPGISVEAAVSADTARFSFAASALAIRDSFSFRLRSGDTATLNTDEVPNSSGALTYFFSKPTPPVVAKPVIAKPTTVPVTPRAGKRLTVSFKLTRSDTGAPLTEGTMSCDPTIEGKKLGHTEVFEASTARVSFVIPKSARGRQLKIQVTVTLGGRSASRIATFRVR